MMRNRRWTLVTSLTLATTIGSLLAVWQVADARTYRCLQNARCTPPPCDYCRQMEMWPALKSVFQSPALRNKMRTDARRANPGLSGAALDAAAARLLEAEVARQAGPNGEIARALRPCYGSKIAEPPSLRTTAECAIVDNASGESIGRERAHQRYDTCSEFINAIYDHEGVHVNACSGPNRTSSTERANMGIDKYGDEEAAGYEAAIQRAKSGLTWWAATCAKMIERDTRRELSRQGVQVLGGGGR